MRSVDQNKTSDSANMAQTELSRVAEEVTTITPSPVPDQDIQLVIYLKKKLSNLVGGCEPLTKSGTQ